MIITMKSDKNAWYRNGILYQVYPRSFCDSNDDGIGDLVGIINKIDYLADLGVTAIWLSPFYTSPMKDFGYDVADYRQVDPVFGNLSDFKKLLDQAHKKDIKVVIDFIPNHSSDQHPWFIESKSSKNNPKRDWYTWHDPSAGGGTPNNWLSYFGGSAWEYDKQTGQYYLHSFLKEQPDLNWDNSEVRKAFCEIAEFWLKMGVDGFRIDTFYWISKDPKFRNDPPNPNYSPETDDPYDSLKHVYSNNGPRLYEYFSELTKVVKSFPEKFIIMEVLPENDDLTEGYIKVYENVDINECAPFNFEGIKLPWKADEFEDFIGSFQSFMEAEYLTVYCMSNHDQPRIVDRIGPEAARVMAMMQLCLPGLPIMYYGDEIGMSGHEVTGKKLKDPFGIRVPGKGLSRDPERTPMQWDSSKNSGFTMSSEPWLPVNPNYIVINVENEKADPSSILNLYKSLISLRKNSDILKHGTYKSLTVHRDIYCFERQYGDKAIVVVLNFSDEEVSIDDKRLSGKILLSTIADRALEDIDGELLLLPNEGVVIQKFVL